LCKRDRRNADKIISQYARKLLSSKLRSTGYHRVAFLLLAQKMGSSRQATVNPRSMLNRTNVQEKHTRINDVYTLNAIARGMDCPSTLQARDSALMRMQTKMNAFIQDKLDAARKRAGFR
jgi:hypothetical protein